MNQWGKNIEDFIAASEQLGYQINKSEQPTSSLEVTGSEAVKKEYLNYFRDQKFEDVIDFIKVTNQLFKSFSWESESDCEEVADLYNKLSEITSTDCPRYGGYLYLFTQISSDMGEGEYDTYFDWDIALEYGYSWHYITSNNQTVVHMVANEYEQNKFNIYFASLFVMTLLRSVDDAQSEDIAEFIVANDIHAYGEAFKDVDVTKMEDYIGDFVIAILKAMNYDINDYEGDCLIEGRHFLDMDLEMGYNYLKLAEDFRDSNV